MRYAGIETTDYGDADTLFFIRIKGAEHFFSAIYGDDVIRSLFGHLKARRTLSEYPNADHWIDPSRYRLADLRPADYDVYYGCIHEDLDAIIARCRGLRSIPFGEAKELVLRTFKWVHEFFRAEPYRLLVIHIIDNYVLDLLVRVARWRGVKVIVLSEWFIRPYRRHTLYGEACSFREPSEQEIDATVQYLSGPQRVFWLEGIDRWNRFRYFLYLFLRYKWLYLTRYVLGYRLMGNEAYEYRFANAWRVRLRDALGLRYFCAVTAAEIDADPDRFVVLPLHTYPEANVDYWMADWRHADYYSGLYEAISFFREQGVTVLAKEHPGFLFQRGLEVYRELAAFDNVRLIDPFSASSGALNRVPLVLVWQGTMGIEAVMQGKRVVVFDRNYYSDGLLQSYREYRAARPVPAAERRQFIRRLLQSVEPIPAPMAAETR